MPPHFNSATLNPSKGLAYDFEHCYFLSMACVFKGISLQEENYWVYILHCENNSYYTGYTNNLTKRYKSHVEGTGGCKYTRSFKPLSIAQSWKLKCTKGYAMRVERYIKKLPRTSKEQLILLPSLLEFDIALGKVSYTTHT